MEEICLEKYKGIRPRIKLGDISGLNIITFNYNKTESDKYKKVMLYSLGENINEFI